MGTIKSKMSDTPKIKRKNRLLDFRSESDPGPTRAETDDAFQEQTERNPVCNSLKTTGKRVLRILTSI